MSEERLRDLLQQVQTELQATETVDAEGRALILQTMGELARVLERSETHAPLPDEEEREAEPLGERLEEAARHFEAEHPQLFTALQQIVDTLRGGGI